MRTKEEIEEYLKDGNIAEIEQVNNTFTGFIDFKTKFLDWLNKEEPVFIKPNEFIKGEFYYWKEANLTWSWILQFDKISNPSDNGLRYYYLYLIHDDKIIQNSNCGKSNWQLATQEQKQLLISKVEQETGLKWNEQTKTFEEKLLLVPENIKIVQHPSDRDKGIFGLCFNNNNQVLSVIPDKNIYEVYPNNFAKEIQCKLIEVPFKQLNVGDIFIELDDDISELDNYQIRLTDKDFCYIDYFADVSVLSYVDGDVGDNPRNFYKVVPIDY